MSKRRPRHYPVREMIEETPEQREQRIQKAEKAYQTCLYYGVDTMQFDGDDHVDGFVFKSEQEVINHIKDTITLNMLVIENKEIPEDLGNRLLRVKELREQKKTDYIVPKKESRINVTDRINITDSSGDKYDIILRGNVIIVQYPDKEIVAAFIKALRDQGYMGYPLEHISSLSGSEGGIIKHIKNSHGVLFLLDDTNRFMSDRLASHVGWDIKNQFLIFTNQELAFNQSPNYYTELVEIDGIHKLKYEYWVDGWRM